MHLHSIALENICMSHEMCKCECVCDLWDLPLVTSVMKNRRWDQTQTLLITTLEIKLAAHWWIFHCHQHSENTSQIYLEVSFVLTLFAWSSIYIKPHLDRIILCTLCLSTSSMISLIRSLSFVPLLQIPQLQIFSYTEISYRHWEREKTQHEVGLSSLVGRCSLPCCAFTLNRERFLKEIVIPKE